MIELDEAIRDIIEAELVPVTAAEVMSGPRTVHVSVRPWRAKGASHRRRWFVTGGLVVGGVAALIAALLTTSATGGGGGRTKPVHLSIAPASEVLRSVATLADKQSAVVPGPGQYLYVRTLGASGLGGGAKSLTTGKEVHWAYYSQNVTQTWTSPTEPGATSTGQVGIPQFLTTADRAAWQDAGSPAIGAQAQGGSPPPYYDVTDLPTDPTQIAAYIARHAGGSAGNVSGSPEWQFDQATLYLGAGASAAQRAALYSFMATLPGVVNYGTTITLGTGLSGIAIGFPGDSDLRIEDVIDTSTSALLELRIVIADPSQFPSAALGGWNAKSGEVQQYSDDVSTGIVDSNTATPPNAPALPTSWPYGQTRAPASTVAFPNL